MLNFYSFEYYSKDWVAFIINPMIKKKTVIVNDREDFRTYYRQHKNEIWITYENKNLNLNILKGLLLDRNPVTIADQVRNGEASWIIDSRFKNITVNNYNLSKGEELPVLEGFMGESVNPCPVKDNDKGLTAEELQEVIAYGETKIEHIVNIFWERESEFNAQTDLVRTFRLPLDCIGKTQTQLASIILKARKKRFYDDWDIRIPDTLKLGKYQYVADWFLEKKNHYEGSSLKVSIDGIEHTFGWGGLHGAKPGRYTAGSDDFIILADTDQLYPSVMVEYGLLSRGVRNPEKYREMLGTSLRLKAEGNKKKREPYKKICNKAYGGMGDENSPLYDPLHRNLVCVYSQLLILDLLEKLEGYAELIQTNTDGIALKVKKEDFYRVDDIVSEWEQRTRLTIGNFEYYRLFIQKSVNEYVAVDYEGKAKRTGAYAKEKSLLDNDLPIVNEAVYKFLAEGVFPETTIRGCTDLHQFQKLYKLTDKYKYIHHNGKRLTEHVVRVFASKNNGDTVLGKQKDTGSKVEKFANCPVHCFIDNGIVKGKAVPWELDKEWYIDMAIKRCAAFGLNADTADQLRLF